MNIRRALDLAADTHPETAGFPEDTRVFWLEELDGKIYEESVKTHTCPPVHSRPRYSASDTGQELLISAPYESVYLDYLAMRAQDALGDAGMYNNRAVAFQNGITAYQKWYHRTHLPLSAAKKRGVWQ